MSTGLSRVRPVTRIDERRAAPRVDAQLEVFTNYLGDTTNLEGRTVNVSWTGLQVQMPEPPRGAHQDMLVRDDVAAALLWVHVLLFRFEPEVAEFWWYAQVLSWDDEWPVLMNRVGLSTDLRLLR